MMNLEIQWNLTRHDCNDDGPVTEVECVIEAEGRVSCDGVDTNPDWYPALLDVWGDED